MAKNDLKFLKYAIKDKMGKKVRVRYYKGELYNYPKGTITVMAKDYGSQLPKELNVKNETDFMTDYFDKDHIRVLPDNPLYDAVLAAYDKQEAHFQKRFAKKGWN